MKCVYQLAIKFDINSLYIVVVFKDVQFVYTVVFIHAYEKQCWTLVFNIVENI